ncbi:arginine--tRNA ligase, partial [Clostridium perfringens]
MLSHLITSSLQQAVNQVCETLGSKLPDSTPIRIEQPASMEHGDYATNIAMQLAKLLRKAPMHIAELIQAELEQDASYKQLVYSTEIVAPGFMNLRIDWEYWAGHHFELPPATNEKIVIEHTSINPNKSAHIG